MKDAPLLRAIKAAGGVNALAKALDVSSQTISQWKRCPPTRCRDVEAATGVTRYQLRPDIYGAAPPCKRAA